MSNDYPLVSIIIPTYNSSDYITETLTKLEKQTYPNFEIVIVNDGSKDNTSNVLREYGLTHSRLIIINKENGGVSSARNTGIRKAQGQFICFMDDDDEIIRLRARIRRASEVKVQNGTYTVNDLLREQHQ